MSDNLLKRGWFVCKDDETRVIDNNDLILEKIEEAARQKSVTEQEESEMPETEEDGFTEGLDAIQSDALFQDTEEENEGETPVIMKVAPVYEGPKPEELAQAAKAAAEEARAEAERLVEAAKEEAANLKEAACEEGKRIGYDAGYQEGMDKIQSMEQELIEREKKLEESYWNKLEEMEPLLVSTINDVYEHVFDVRFSEDKNLILHLVTGALQSIEGSRDFMIHVSPHDYAAVREEKENLKDNAASGNITLEIIEDMTLSVNECMIETGNGIYDCSLGTQLEGLRKELKLLSFQKN